MGDGVIGFREVKVDSERWLFLVNVVLQFVDHSLEVLEFGLKAY